MLLRSYIYDVAIAGLLALSLSACSDAPDEPEAPAQRPEPRIEIAAGTAAPSRADADEPQQPGRCSADRLALWLFRAEKLTTVTPAAADLTTLSATDDIAVARFSGENNSDKWTTWATDLTAAGSRNTAFALPALAYTAADRDAFSVAADSYTGLALSLTGDYTPEIYFGRLGLEALGQKSVTNKDLEDKMTAGNDGLGYIHNSGLVATTYSSSPAYGKLYRIVSQLNLTITDIDPSQVKRLDMYLTNIPTSLSLFGSHGKYYPVDPSGAAHKGSEKEPVAVASATDFTDSRATLSTFILPSYEGRKLLVKVTYASGAVKSFDICPKADALLPYGTGGADVYTGVPDELRSGNDIIVYASADNKFYSYANVRVNLSGRFEDVLSQTMPVDIDIEVCRFFERTHQFDIATD